MPAKPKLSDSLKRARRKNKGALDRAMFLLAELVTSYRYTGQDAALVVDTKMKVLDRGMGVAILSLFVTNSDQLI